MWFNKKNILITVFIFGIVIWSSIGTGVRPIPLDNFVAFSERFFPPNWDRTNVALSASLITLQVAFLGTILALLVAIPISFLAANNTSPNGYVYHTVRSMLSFLRSVPDIVLGLFFVVLIGLGPYAAVLAIFIHNVGVLGKLIAELIESADKGPQEAVQSMGLCKSMVALYGVLPQIIPNVLSHYFYRFEVAIRTSLILGFIGAGGIGQLLFNDFQTFRYDNVSLYVLFIMGLVVFVDMLGSYVRNRVI
ncbi:phosphonate ABC transporter, permease protein PhnE [Salipaludibacillus neizhouensis]|uniref:Phosphonate ABC transporter, permease protein PhnE n=1 Tax=Salipaludibacillus neizhouensis TaxID=885475 RepID=A0A3A9KHP4_9BACI|nr:phosphonate ABC transporter, permease protein PhnE [Salipaludibacillus neizhouensis]RKL67195.1 phosphonate ABC transporter, permease protein PhnE [Salipaludibacillus neizhouensis]